jgi:SRSO17 transposase
MKKQYPLNDVWQGMIRRELLEKIGKKARLVIDSTIKGKRGQKLHNLQKFKTTHGYTIGHCFVVALLICEDNSHYIVAVKPYLTKKFSKRTQKEFKTQNQLAVEILREMAIPIETHLSVVADSAFLADFVVDEIRRHPTWSFVSSMDSNRKITVNGYTSHTRDFMRRHMRDLKKMSIVVNGRKNNLKVMSTEADVSKVGEAIVVVSCRGCQTITLAGIGEKLSCKDICTAYLLRWRIEIVFKELKQYLHFGSYHFREFEAYMNHVLMVIIAYSVLKLLYPNHTIAEAKKAACQSSHTVFLSELKHDLTKFNGNKIVKNKILQAISDMPNSFSLRIAS